MRIASVPWQGFCFAAVLAATLWSAMACAGGNGGRPGASARSSPAPGVMLEAEVLHDGLIVLRSPMFRWAPGYCAGVVISALEQALGKERIAWDTAAVPGQSFVELRVTYDPTQLGPEAIVAATKAAMEAHPDPAHSGPVQVVLRGQWRDGYRGERLLFTAAAEREGVTAMWWLVLGFIICCGLPVLAATLFTLVYLPWHERRRRREYHEWGLPEQGTIWAVRAL